MKKMKKQLAVAVTVALLAFPLSSALAQESTPDTPVVVATTALQVETTEAVAAAAVVAYEAGPIITLAEVATAEGLKVAADTAVAAVVDVEAKTAFELRVTDRAAAIATAKTALTAPVVDADGNEIAPATLFSDLINKLQLALAFDPARKGELNKRHALRKLAQAQKLMQEGNIEASQNCLNEYTDKIAKAQAFLIEVEDTNSDTAKTLAKALVNVEANNIQVLSNLVDKLPPQAAQKLALNVVRTMEKAVIKIQKEEAKVALETTPATTPVTDSKVLEKQAKVALAEFKKSLKQNGKIHIDDQDQDQDEDQDQEDNRDKNKQNSHQVTQSQSLQIQSIIPSQPTHVTIAPVKTQTAPTFRMSENNKDDRNKQDDHQKDKGGDNRRDHK